MDYVPNDKIALGTLGGGLAAVIIWLLSLWGIEVDSEVAAALAVVAGSVVAYLVPERFWLRGLVQADAPVETAELPETKAKRGKGKK